MSKQIFLLNSIDPGVLCEKDVGVQIFQDPDHQFGLPFSIIRPLTHFAGKRVTQYKIVVLPNFKILVSI